MLFVAAVNKSKQRQHNKSAKKTLLPKSNKTKHKNGNKDHEKVPEKKAFIENKLKNSTLKTFHKKIDVKSLIAKIGKSRQNIFKPEHTKTPKLKVMEVQEHHGHIKARRYDIREQGDPRMFRGWADVQGQGAANDYCR